MEGSDGVELKEKLDEQLILFDFEAENKVDALKKIAHMMYATNKIDDEESYVDGLLEREKEYATGIGNGIAIPHCKKECVREAAFTLVKLKDSIDWGSGDGIPVKYVIMLAAPDDETNPHIDMLAALARKLMDQEFRQSLLNANTIDDIKKIFN